jgi:ketosteroid isomerase-like protein
MKGTIMPANSPEQAHELFVSYFNSGDVDAVMSLYEPNATMVQLSGPAIQGHGAIRNAIIGFLSLKGQMELAIDRAVESDDVALLFSTWTLRGTGPDGKPLETSGQTTDVVRRQPDGGWLFVIDNPYGVAVVR